MTAPPPPASTPWRIREPVEWDAETAKVQQLLHEILSLRANTFVDRASLSTLTNEQAIASSTRITLKTSDGSTRTATIAATPDEKGQYPAFLNDSETCFLLDKENLQWLSAERIAPLHYRDLSVLKVAPETIWRLETIQNGTTQAVERVDGKWQVSGDSGHPDEASITQLVHALGNLRAITYETRNPSELSVFGLEESAVSLTARLRGDAGIQRTLFFGFLAPSGGVYTRIKGQDSVFVLSRDDLAILTANLITPAAPREGTVSQ